MQFDLKSLPLFARYAYSMACIWPRDEFGCGRAKTWPSLETQIDALKVIDRDNRVWISRFADRRTAAGYHRYPPSMACVWAGAMADGACRPRLRGAAVHTTAA